MINISQLSKIPEVDSVDELAAYAKLFLKASGITQRDLSDFAKLNLQVLNKILNLSIDDDEPTFKVAYKLGQLLAVIIEAENYVRDEMKGGDLMIKCNHDIAHQWFLAQKKG